MVTGDQRSMGLAGHFYSSPCPRQKQLCLNQLSGVHVQLLLSTASEGDSPASLGILSWCCTTLNEKVLPHIQLENALLQLSPLFLVLSPVDSETRPSPSSL